MELKLSQSNCCKIQIKCSKYEGKKILVGSSFIHSKQLYSYIEYNAHKT